MYFPLQSQSYEAIVDHFNSHGFVVLTGVDPAVAAAFRKVLGETIGMSDEQIRRAGEGDAVPISRDARAKLARPEMTPEIRQVLFEQLGELLIRLLGPFVHVSNSYHPQIKRSESTYILKGYSGDGLEVEAPYGLHQDFTAARLVTSPNAIVCWVPLNNCDYNALRVYTNSVGRGMLANRWLRPDEAGVERIGESVEVMARDGHLLLFNFLVLHGTTRPGPATRISCDARFFPFCGILDSEATVLTPQPLEWIRARLEEHPGDTLAGPLYETLAYLGEPIDWPALGAQSVLHWARFIEGLVQGDPSQMRDAIERFANVDGGFDELAGYVARFQDVALEPRPYQSVASRLPSAARERVLALAGRLGQSAAAAQRG